MRQIALRKREKVTTSRPDTKKFYFCNCLSSIPRQSGSADDKPGEKSMMRKLVVAVFVFSFAALGCGSDEGSPAKNDTGVPPDGPKADAAMGPDTTLPTPDAPVVPDAPVAPEAGPEAQQADLPPAIDVTPAGEAGQTTEAGTQTDLPPVQVDGGATDGTPQQLDGGIDGDTDGGEDVEPGEVAVPVDSGTIDGDFQD
jgi:hypothetical protein